MNRHYYSDTIYSFRVSNPDEILGTLVRNNEFSTEPSQKQAWLYQINLLQDLLNKHEGAIFFEYSIPRMGKRIDV
jgi:hypothetical protein